MHRRSRALGSGTALLAAGLLLAVPEVSAAQDATPVKVLHVVLDGVHPSQIGPDTPNLQALKDAGVWYEQSRSVMSSETLPNHVAMATGTYPATNGIPGNDGRIVVGDTEAGDLGPREHRLAESLISAIERTCPDLRTVSAFAKPYVHLSLGGEADADFDQSQYNVPVAETAPDATLMSFLVPEMAQNGLADHTFINFGDVDRSGHVDANAFAGQTGFQRVALQELDTNVGTIVQNLQQSGEWANTVMLVNSDHSMDYSPPFVNAVDVIGALEADAATAGAFFGATNFGSMFVYLLDPARADADAVLAAARAVITGLDGVDEALYREPNAADPGNDLRTVHPGWRNWTPRVGEIMVTALPGWKLGSQSESFLPGNHGMVKTRHATMLVAGGWDGIDAGKVISADPALVDPYDDTDVLTGQSENVDIAPTAGWLLGVEDPGLSRGESAQWEGRPLVEAFTRRPAPACAPAIAVEPLPPTPEPAPEPEPEPAPLPATGGGFALVALGLAVLARGRR